MSPRDHFNSLGGLLWRGGQGLPTAARFFNQSGNEEGQSSRPDLSPSHMHLVGLSLASCDFT